MTIDLTIERAALQINNLQQQLKQARRENRLLRSKTDGSHSYHRNTTPRILRRALDDSISIVLLRTNGLPVSRRYLYEAGFSHRRYSWAMGLLRSARLVSPRGTAWRETDFLTAEAKVKAEYEKLKGQPNALEMLRLYMPKNMQNTYKGKGW